MALVDISATQTDNLLDPGQLEELIKEDLLFRDKQLKRLKNEILDLEDFDDSVSLTDFSLDEFRLDLLQYIESRKAELEEAPAGLYAVVPPKAEIPACKPGVIFCLRHTGTQANAPKSRPADSRQHQFPLRRIFWCMFMTTVRYGTPLPSQKNHCCFCAAWPLIRRVPLSIYVTSSTPAPAKAPTWHTTVILFRKPWPPSSTPFSVGQP